MEGRDMDITKRENFNAWLKWLRDNPERQSDKQLKTPQEDGTDKFCCLGVACQISGLGGWDKLHYFIPGGERQQYFLPDEVVEWLGFDKYHNDPDFSYGDDPDDYKSLSGRNDDGDSFEVIADALEAEYGGDENWQ
jgi:hypothetical protein